jgi:hypothetical protein
MIESQPTRRRRFRVSIEFKRQDCWVGVFWRTENLSTLGKANAPGILTTWWVCLVPMVPIVIQRVRWLHDETEPPPKGEIPTMRTS